MVLTLKEAEKNLIVAQKLAQRAYKNVEKAREIYYKLEKKSMIIKNKKTLKKSKKKNTLRKRKNMKKK